jgi:hypothetical protein
MAAQCLTLITFTVCVLSLSSSSYRFNAIETASRLFPDNSIGNPRPARTPSGGNAAASLINGTEIKDRLRLDGRGEVTIKNGTSYDAIVNLVEPTTMRAVRSFYVQTGKTFVEKNIAPGRYEIYFSTGKDWDSSTRLFEKDASYGRLERSIEFSEKLDVSTGQVRFCGFEVTLQAVEGGDVASLPVDRQTFQAMMEQPSDSAKLEKETPRSKPSNSN